MSNLGTDASRPSDRHRLDERNGPDPELARLIRREAEAILRGTDHTDPDVLSMLRLGELLASRGHYHGLARAYRRRAAALSGSEKDGSARFGSTTALQWYGDDSAEREREARDLRQGAESSTPMSVAAARLLVDRFEREERSQDAAAAWCHLGEAFQQQGDLSEAVDAYEHALSVKSDCLRAFWGLAGTYLQLAEPAKSLEAAESALAIEPEHHAAYQLSAWASHQLGDIERGWQRMAYYDPHIHEKRRYFEQPLWDGGAVEGKRLLLWADEALGDTIQWIRYSHLAKAKGAHVIVECHRRLLPLIKQMDSVDDVVGHGVPLPSFDLHAPMSDLPRMLGTRPGSVPCDVPYLSVDPELIAEWRARIRRESTGTLVAGLVWGGVPSRPTAGVRFTSLATFAPLAGVRHVRFVSLQQGLPQSDLLAPPPGLVVAAFREETRSIADTAALMLNLDLLITVDTMAAHLAGALARPVWTLLPYGPDWRWPIRGETSTWYPTMRLFHQSRRGDWSELMTHVRDALDSLAERLRT